MSTDTPTATAATSQNGSGAVRHFDTVVIGAGFAGIGAAIKLEEAGFDDFAVLEKSDRLGGTWRDNTYPGCSCDVPSTLYSFSFALYPGWDRVFAEQPQIQAYLEHVASEYGVEDRIHFGTEVLEATWHPEEQRWHVKTSAGPYTARLVIAGAGPLHEPNIPDIPGIDTFEGKVFHSARWDHDYDLTGRKVAVVGTGSSAIQFVPKIQPQVEKLHLFQRTAPWVLPKLDRRIPKGEKALFRRFPRAQKAARNMIYMTLELVQLAQRRPKVMQRIQKVMLLHLKRQVKDPEMQRALTPNFTLGCKRMLLSNTYYKALTKPNAEVVPHAVDRITPTGVVGADGIERDVDTIIFGTGFHVTDPPISERVKGADGRSVADTWAGSPRGYLGTAVTGFPNFFLLFGPNVGNGHSSAIVLIEAQLGYIVDALRTMCSRGAGSVEVRRDVQEAYNERVQAALAGTVWNSGGCQSYYLDRNGNNATIYPWTTIDLRRRTARFDPDDYLLETAVPQRAAA
jgi:cation diffusion facilitator CzcD-associated flavoprotein CzcO